MKLKAVLCAMVLCSLGAVGAQAKPPLAWEKPLVKEIYPEADPKVIASDSQSHGSGILNESASALIDKSVVSKAHVRVLVYRMPQDFDYEFALLVVDGKIQRAFVISSAMDGKEPILGTHRLVVPDLNGRPWPWRTSVKFFNSPMYWGLQVNGGYFIHSSPHYGNLGAPASMGCMRTSLPDAMEMFNLVANRFAGSASYIVINEKLKLSSNSDDAKALVSILDASGWTLDQLKTALQNSKNEIAAVSKGDLEFSPGIPVDAHVRPFSDTVQNESAFPSCGGTNCWDFFKKDRDIIRLKPNVLSKNPEVDSFQGSSNALAIISGNQLKLSELLNGAIDSKDPFNINDIQITLKATSGALQVRVCDTLAKKCSRPRGPAAGASGEFIYPMYQISEQLKSSAGLILDVQGGAGELQGITVRYFR